MKTPAILFFACTIIKLSVAQPASPTIKTTRLDDNLYQFFIYIDENSSVNVYASLADEGILLIDAGYLNTSDLIKSELKKLSGKEVKWIVNTHYDGDHTLGNAALGASATIVSHQKCRDLLARWAAFPREGLADITFQDSLTIFLGGETIHLSYFPGHTSSDIVVKFTKANIAFTGDLAFSGQFPTVHDDGNAHLLEKNLTCLSKLLDADTRIFPGHGDEIKVWDLKAYVKMVSETKNLVIRAINEGKNPEEAKNSKILKGYEKWNSKLFPRMNADSWIDDLYATLDEYKKFSACPALQKTLEKSGLEAMQKQYREILTRKENKLHFIENEFNNWGYALMGEQKIKEAIVVFIINVEQFPLSANAYDSLGEAYMVAGNKDLAVKNYKKSLELNPQNTNAVEQLKKLEAR